MAPINSLTVVDESSTSNMASPGSICVKIAASAPEMMLKTGASSWRRSIGSIRQSTYTIP